jgi:hypothetical protein
LKPESLFWKDTGVYVVGQTELKYIDVKDNILETTGLSTSLGAGPLLNRAAVVLAQTDMYLVQSEMSYLQLASISLMTTEVSFNWVYKADRTFSGQETTARLAVLDDASYPMIFGVLCSHSSNGASDTSLYFDAFTVTRADFSQRTFYTREGIWS